VSGGITGEGGSREGRSLPPLLEDGLAAVFVGTEPGTESVRRGEYYANPRNRFYEHLAVAGFTPRQITPGEFRELISFGIGLDDVYDNPEALRSRIEAVQPRSICFNSYEALRRYAQVDRVTRPWRRDAAARHADFLDSLVWATSDSSWNASSYWQLRIDDLHALRALLSR
jgi:TDG/mug DNA glycosylase family protein